MTDTNPTQFDQQIQSLQKIIMDKNPHLTTVDVRLDVHYNNLSQRTEYRLSALGFSGLSVLHIGSTVRPSWGECFETARQLFYGNPAVPESEIVNTDMRSYRGLGMAINNPDASLSTVS